MSENEKGKPYDVLHKHYNKVMARLEQKKKKREEKEALRERHKQFMQLTLDKIKTVRKDVIQKKRSGYLIMYLKLGSLNAVAKKVGVSREYIRQLISPFREYKESIQKRHRPFVQKNCIACQKPFTTISQSQKSCSVTCAGVIRRLTPEQRIASARRLKEKSRIYHKNYYHNVFKKRPDWRERVRIYNARYAPLRKKRHGQIQQDKTKVN